MRKSDDGLRALFRNHLLQFHWTTIETGMVTMGVADSNYLHYGGVEGWVEHKATRKWSPKIRPQQISWIHRRARLGGRCWIAVRRRHGGGPRLGDPVDQLWMVPAAHVRELASGGLRMLAGNNYGVTRFWYWAGGPGCWDWEAVAGLLLSVPARPLAGTASPVAAVSSAAARLGRPKRRTAAQRAVLAALRER